MTGEIKLLPCPFCGKQPLSRWWGVSDSADDGGYWDISCCGAFAHEDDEAAAAKVWNKRHSQAERKPWLDAVEQAIRENPYINYSFAAQNNAVEKNRAEKYVRMIARAAEKLAGGASSPPMNNDRAALADYLIGRGIDNESAGSFGPCVIITPTKRDEIVTALREITNAKHSDVHITARSACADAAPITDKRLELARNGFAAIKAATIKGDVCDDVAWFDQIETLHDYCERMIDALSREESRG